MPFRNLTIAALCMSARPTLDFYFLSLYNEKAKRVKIEGNAKFATNKAIWEIIRGSLILYGISRPKCDTIFDIIAKFSAKSINGAFFLLTRRALFMAESLTLDFIFLSSTMRKRKE